MEHSGCRPVPWRTGARRRADPSCDNRAIPSGALPGGIGGLAAFFGSEPSPEPMSRRRTALGGSSASRTAPGPRLVSASARTPGDARPDLRGDAPEPTIRPTAVLPTPRTLEHLQPRPSAARRATGRAGLIFGVVPGSARVPNVPGKGPGTGGQGAHPLMARTASGRSRSRRVPIGTRRAAPRVGVRRLARVRHHPGRRARVLRA